MAGIKLVYGTSLTAKSEKKDYGEFDPEKAKEMAKDLYTITIQNQDTVRATGCEPYKLQCQSVEVYWETGRIKKAKDVKIPDSLNDPCQVRI